MENITATIITRNEEGNIRRCLESLDWADEIVVVDDLSTDRTVEICREYTDRVFLRRMDGFGEQKQYAVEQATHDWIFSIDADEFVSDELRASILRKKEEGFDCDGYEVFRRTEYLGRWIYDCGWYVPILRLFNRRAGQFNDNKVHEMVIVDGRVGRLEGDLIHHTYRDIAHHIEKFNQFTSLDAQIVDNKGIVLRPTNYLWYFVVKPFLAFLRKYVVLKGYKDGVHGFLISVFTGMIVFIMHVKAWELQKNRRRGHLAGTETTEERAPRLAREEVSTPTR